MVEFSDLSMRVRTPGNFSDEQLDEILLFLKQRVSAQENKEVTRLHYFYHVLNKYVSMTRCVLLATLRPRILKTHGSDFVIVA